MIPASPPVAAAELVRLFLADLAADVAAGRRAAATHAYYRHYLGKALALLPAGLAAADCRPLHFRDLPKSFHWRQAVKRVWRWGMMEGYFDVDPLRNLQMPPCGRRERTLTAAELEKIIQACPPHLKYYVYALAQTGARPGELRTLTWSNVDLDGAYARVRDYKAKRRRKDGTPPCRYVALDATTVDLLRQLRQIQQEVGLGGEDDRVFVGKHGQPLRANAVVLGFRRACRRAGIDDRGERVVLYTLRHTRATELTILGTQQVVLMHLLGHTRPSTTVRYQHPDLQAIHEALRAAPVRLAPVVPVDLADPPPHPLLRGFPGNYPETPADTRNPSDFLQSL